MKNKKKKIPELNVQVKSLMQYPDCENVSSLAKL